MSIVGGEDRNYPTVLVCRNAQLEWKFRAGIFLAKMADIGLDDVALENPVSQSCHLVVSLGSDHMICSFKS